MTPSEQNLTLEWGERYDVQWTGTLEKGERVRVALYDSLGAHWDLAVVKGRNHWVWQVGQWDLPGQPAYSTGVGYRIRVSTLDDAVEDYSDYDFAIGTPNSIIVTGPIAVVQNSAAQYHCIARYDVGTTADVTASAKWSVGSRFARIRKGGQLTTKSVPADQSCAISASYGRGKSALSTRYDITITRDTPSEQLAIEDVTVLAPSSSAVAQYDKVELLVTLSHVAATRYYEPDPAADGLDLSAAFTSPSEAVWNVNGFYDGQRWLIRFAPDEVGAWTFSVRAQDKSGAATWSAGAFACAASNYAGWPRISGRYLRHAEGFSFLPIGHNTGWQASVEQPAFAEMAASGENLLSFWLAMPWAQPSWATQEDPSWAERAPIENSEQGIGNYNSAACAYIDGVVARAEAAGVCLLPTIWSHGQLRDVGHPWGQGWWANNAYNSICSATDFFKTTSTEGDTPQWRCQKNFYRYLIARWGCSRAVAGWVAMCEIEGTTGYVQNASQAETWCEAVRDYFRANDRFRRAEDGAVPVTFSRSDAPSWRSGLDLRATDSYASQRNNVAVAATLASQVATMRASGVPCLHTEFGGDTVNGATQPAHLHNGLWGGLMAGAASSPLLWCDGGNFPMLTPEMSNHLKHIAEFVSGLDYLADSTAAPASLALDSPSCRGWGMALSSRACAWVQNTGGTMGGQSLTFSGLDDGSYSVAWYDVWSSGGLPIATDDVASGGGALELIIPELARSDIACRVEPAGTFNGREAAENALTATSALGTPSAGSLRLRSGQAGQAARSTAAGALAEPAQMEFSRKGINGEIAAAVERVVGNGRVQVATVQHEEARLVCVVVDADRRCRQLDQGLQAESFPALAAGGFSQPPDAVSRTMSIYRAVIMQTMRYQAERGDRVVLLLCPRDQWPQLQLQWP